MPQPSLMHSASPTEPAIDAAPADTFADRARELVAFLADAPPGSTAQRQQERELADWIARWKKALGCSRAHHFVAEELGIIMRALSGPPPNAVRWHPGSNERMCWLIARCMADSV